MERASCAAPSEVVVNLRRGCFGAERRRTDAAINYCSTELNFINLRA
jgi:hypothetical protein